MSNKVITGEVRFSYVHVFEPYAADPSQTAKYSVSIIIPKTDTKTINAIKQATEQAITDGVAEKFGGKRPANIHTPLRDGDTERPDDEAYANSYFLNATTTKAPGVVDLSRSPIMSADEFYSGCYGYASINLYAYNTSGNRGIAAGLNNIMKSRDGEAMGATRASAESDFAGISVYGDDCLD